MEDARFNKSTPCISTALLILTQRVFSLNLPFRIHPLLPI